MSHDDVEFRSSQSSNLHPPAGTRRVLVTGAGSGIGRAVAKAVVGAGGSVVAVGRRPALLDSLADEHPGHVHPLPCDLTDAEQRRDLVARAADALGGLDGLVHSAGMVVHQEPGQIDEDSLRAQLELNLVAPLRLGEQALEALEPGGAVVFVSSTLASRPLASSAVYSASKAGLEAALKSLALAGAPRKIRFNAVSPGLVDTDMVRTVRVQSGEAIPEGDALIRRQKEQLEAMRALHPLGRLGKPEDVASAVLHLLGASWTTGTTLVTDGGLLLRE